MCLPVQNFNGVTVQLEAGMRLGTVKPVEVSTVGDLDVSCNATVKVVDSSLEHLEELYSELKHPPDSLSSAEVMQLKFSDVFALDDSELGCTNILQHSVNTRDHPPIKQQPHRTPVVRMEKVAEMISAMEKQGVVQPSTSPWASPVVLVPKKDRSLRFCVDYQRLNSVTRKDVYPLPRVDDIFDTLGEVKYFSTLDLASGYWQVELDEDARAKSALLLSKVL